MKWHKWLLRTDVALSRPIFHWKAPKPLEYLLSVPGNFFGNPLVAYIVAPNCLALCFAKEETSLRGRYSTLASFLVVLTLWAAILFGSKRLKSKAIRVFYGPKLGAFAPLVGILMLNFLHADDVSSTQIGYFQMACWSFAVIPVAILKPLCRRRRPSAVLLEDKSYVLNKHLPMLPRLFAKDEYASFPSGDTAGAVAVMFPLLKLGNSASEEASIARYGVTLATIMILLSVLGRIYFQAHHVLDVTVGVLIGLTSSQCLAIYLLVHNGSATDGDDRVCCQLEWHQAGKAHLVLLITVIASRALLRQKVFDSGTIRVGEQGGTTGSPHPVEELAFRKRPEKEKTPSTTKSSHEQKRRRRYPWSRLFNRSTKDKRV